MAGIYQGRVKSLGQRRGAPRPCSRVGVLLLVYRCAVLSPVGFWQKFTGNIHIPKEKKKRGRDATDRESGDRMMEEEMEPVFA